MVLYSPSQRRKAQQVLKARASRPAAVPRTITGRLDYYTNEELAAMVVSGHRDASKIEAHLIERNSALIHAVLSRYRWSGEDLWTTAVAGFLDGLRRFDPARGVKLSTMVTNWIRQRVQREVETVHATIRVPSYVQDIGRVLGRWRDAQGLTTAEVDALTDHELALALSTPEKPVSASQVSLARKATNQPTVSLDSPYGDTETDLITLMQGHEADPLQAVMETECTETIDALVQDLPERYRKLLLLRFVDGLTLGECGAQLGISRERARQIEAEALRHLRLLIKASSKAREVLRT